MLVRGIRCTSAARRPTLPLRRSPLALPRRNLRRGHDGLAGQPRGEPAAAPELAAEAGRGAAQERGRVQLLWPRGQRLRPVALQAADARRGPLLAGPRAVQLPPHDAGAGATPARVLFRRSRVPRSSRRRNACGTSSSACARRGTTSRRAAGAGRASTRARARAERWADLFRRRRERAAARSRRRAPGHAPQPAPREAAGLAELGELQHVRHPEQVHLRAVSPVQLWPVDDARRRVPPRPALPPGDRARRSRPFFDPLPNSCQSTIRERLRRHNPNQP